MQLNENLKAKLSHVAGMMDTKLQPEILHKRYHCETQTGFWRNFLWGSLWNGFLWLWIKASIKIRELGNERSWCMKGGKCVGYLRDHKLPVRTTPSH
jgi:hypothetical protein